MEISNFHTCSARSGPASIGWSGVRASGRAYTLSATRYFIMSTMRRSIPFSVKSDLSFFKKINSNFFSGEARPPGDGMYRRPLLRRPMQLGAAPERTSEALPGEQTNKMHSNSSVFAALNRCGVTFSPLSCRFCEKNLLSPPRSSLPAGASSSYFGRKKSERGKVTSLSAV